MSACYTYVSVVARNVCLLYICQYSACYTYVSVVARNGCLLVIHMSVW